jgi:hypothetical protein
MITLSTSFHNRIMRELRRAVGSEGRLAFFDGKMPLFPDDSAEGERVESREVTDADLDRLCLGHEPEMPKAAGYWRLLDNGGLVLMQGDAKLDA